MESKGGKQVAFVLYSGLTPLDLIGPLQVMSGLKLFAPEWTTIVVGERVEPMVSDVGLVITPQATFGDVSDPTVVIVPGGGGPTIRQMGNPILREYLLSVAERAQAVGSVCTGSLILAAAGLLEGRKATTHWSYHALLDRLGATYVAERWVEDGKFITSAGVSAGIDMALQLAARLTDQGRAKLVQLGIEYDPHPPFGGIEWASVNLDLMAPIIEQQVRTELAGHADLHARLLSAREGVAS